MSCSVSKRQDLLTWHALDVFAAGKFICQNRPEAALAWHLLYGPIFFSGINAAEYPFKPIDLKLAQLLQQGQVFVYPTKQECCRAGGLGAFSQGCTGDAR